MDLKRKRKHVEPWVNQVSSARGIEDSVTYMLGNGILVLFSFLEGANSEEVSTDAQADDGEVQAKVCASLIQILRRPIYK